MSVPGWLKNALRLKEGTHEATNCCNTLLQQIALCVQSSGKSHALIAAIGSSGKSPGVNASTFDACSIKILSPRQNFVAATCRTKLNQFDFVMLQRQNFVAATKFSIKFSCSHDEICCCDVLLRRVAAIYRPVCFGLKNAQHSKNRCKIFIDIQWFIFACYDFLTYRRKF